MEQKNQCEKNVSHQGEWGLYQCSKNATVKRNGKYYCTIHDPIKIEERQKAEKTKWDKEWKDKMMKYEYEDLAVKYCKKLGLTTEQLNSQIKPKTK